MKSIVLLRRAETKTTSNNQLMSSGVIFDGTEELPYVMFGITTEISEHMKPGVIIEMTLFKEDYYQDNKQIQIQAIKTVNELPGNSGLVPECAQSEEVLMGRWEKIKSIIINKDSRYNKLFETINKSNWFPTFKIIPAAKGFHHAYIRGLFEHSISVAELAYEMSLKYNRGAFEINTGMMLFATLVHDVGKIWEYNINPVTNLFESRTTTGKLHGHIQNTIRVVEPLLRGVLTAKEIDLFMHLIESHHSKIEWGALVEPVTMESYILAQVDNIDSALNAIEGELSGSQDGWTYVPRFKMKFLRTDK